MAIFHCIRSGICRTFLAQIVMASGLRVVADITYIPGMAYGIYAIHVYITFPPKYTLDNIGGMCNWTDYHEHKGERYRLSNEKFPCIFSAVVITLGFLWKMLRLALKADQI